MNLHLIHGRLARDPELTRGDDPSKDRVKFTVAVDRKFGDETDFFDCTAFGKLADVVDKYAHKGKEVLCSGEGQIRSYDDKNGVRRKAYSIIVRDFRLCGSKSDGQTTAPNEPIPENFEEVTEDIPF